MSDDSFERAGVVTGIVSGCLRIAVLAGIAGLIFDSDTAFDIAKGSIVVAGAAVGVGALIVLVAALGRGR